MLLHQRQTSVEDVSLHTLSGLKNTQLMSAAAKSQTQRRAWHLVVCQSSTRLGGMRQLPDLSAVCLKRRELLLGGIATVWLASRASCAAAVLKSVRSERPGALTLRNDLEASARVYWINYDGEAAPMRFDPRNAARPATSLGSDLRGACWLYTGDPEFFAALPPGGYFTVDTFEVRTCTMTLPNKTCTMACI